MSLFVPVLFTLLIFRLGLRPLLQIYLQGGHNVPADYETALKYLEEAANLVRLCVVCLRLMESCEGCVCDSVMVRGGVHV